METNEQTKVERTSLNVSKPIGTAMSKAAGHRGMKVYVLADRVCAWFADLDNDAQDEVLKKGAALMASYDTPRLTSPTLKTGSTGAALTGARVATQNQGHRAARKRKVQPKSI